MGVRCVAVLRSGGRCPHRSSPACSHCHKHIGWTFGNVRPRPKSTTQSDERPKSTAQSDARPKSTAQSDERPKSTDGDQRVKLLASLPSTGDSSLDRSLLLQLGWVTPTDQLVLLMGFRRVDADATNSMFRALLLKYHPDKGQVVARDYPHGLQAVMLWRKAYPRLGSAASRS